MTNSISDAMRRECGAALWLANSIQALVAKIEAEVDVTHSVEASERETVAEYARRAATQAETMRQVYLREGKRKGDGMIWAGQQRMAEACTQLVRACEAVGQEKIAQARLNIAEMNLLIAQGVELVNRANEEYA